MECHGEYEKDHTDQQKALKELPDVPDMACMKMDHKYASFPAAARTFQITGLL